MGNKLAVCFFGFGHHLSHHGKKLAIGILFSLQNSRLDLPDAFHCSHNAFFSSQLLLVILRFNSTSIPYPSYLKKQDSFIYRNFVGGIFRGLHRNLREIKCYGRIKWQSDRDYGKRNQAERAIGRYKRILGNRLHSREFERQRQEAIIGCSILNKMVCISLAEIRSKF